MNQSTLKYTIAHFNFNLLPNVYTMMIDKPFMVLCSQALFFSSLYLSIIF